MVDDYGISWDELSQLEIGTANYRYLVKGDQALLTLRDRYYGPLFEIFLVRVMDQSSPTRDVSQPASMDFPVFLRRGGRFLRAGVVILRNGWLALLGSAMLAISPRIFADAFYNSKDIPFLSGSIFAALSLLWYLRKPGWKRLLVHALCSAALIGIRFAGIYMLALTGGMLLAEVLARRQSGWRAVRDGIVYLLLTGVLSLAVLSGSVERRF